MSKSPGPTPCISQNTTPRGSIYSPQLATKLHKNRGKNALFDNSPIKYELSNSFNLLEHLASSITNIKIPHTMTKRTECNTLSPKKKKPTEPKVVSLRDSHSKSQLKILNKHSP